MIDTVVAFVTDPAKMSFVAVSMLLGFCMLFLWRYSNKTWLLYAHLGFILAPLFYFAFSINCNLSLVKSILGFCTTIFAKLVLYGLPPTMLATFILGSILVPAFYKRRGKLTKLLSFSNLCRKTKISAKLYVLDKAKPVAFAFADFIFVSVGMFELLSRKEVEAVLLHELYHVKRQSSWSKFTHAFVGRFSPFARFLLPSILKEEYLADSFARKIQGTNKYLAGARRKVRRY